MGIDSHGNNGHPIPIQVVSHSFPFPFPILSPIPITMGIPFPWSYVVDISVTVWLNCEALILINKIAASRARSILTWQSDCLQACKPPRSTQLSTFRGTMKYHLSGGAVIDMIGGCHGVIV